MVKIKVTHQTNNDTYTHDSYRKRDTWSSFGNDMGWLIPETLSTVIDGIGQIEKTFRINTGALGICNTPKLMKGLGTVSSGLEGINAVTASPVEIWDNVKKALWSAKDCVDRINAIASLLGELSTICGAIKFLHRIEAVNLSHLMGGIDVIKYSAGLSSCVLKIYTTYRWIDAPPKNACPARISAKKYSYWSNGSLGMLYAALLISKRFKVASFIFIGLSGAMSVTMALTYFKGAEADHAEAAQAFSHPSKFKMAPAA